jgi:hypothetical protein
MRGSVAAPRSITVVITTTSVATMSVEWCRSPVLPLGLPMSK